MSIPDGSTTVGTLGFITASFPGETDVPGVKVVSLRPTSTHNNTRALSWTTGTGNNQQSASASNSESSSTSATPIPISFPTRSASGSPPFLTNASTIIQPTTSATVHNGSKSRILPIAVTIPVMVFSIILIALNMYYFRRRKRLHAMLLPHVNSDDQALIQDVRNGMGSSPRYQVMEPFHISRIVPTGKFSWNTKAKPRRLVFDTPRQAPEAFPSMTTSGIEGLNLGPPMEQNDTTVRRNDEMIGPSNPRRRSSLVEQVGALQERLRVMEDTMNLESGLGEVIPPPEYTPTPNIR